MKNPSLEEIDNIRKEGLRPQVVGCFLNNRKILFLFKRKHDLWQLPQGGIRNKETIKQALIREMTEELGSDFTDTVDNREIKIIGQDQIIFPEANQNRRDLMTDQGKEVFMKGKGYYFVVVNSDQDKLDIKKTEFDDYRWLIYDQAMELVDSIYQSGKKRITIKALDLLKESELLN